MLFLIAGVAILCGLLLLVYLFVNADPARLAEAAKWAGIAVAVALVLALLVVTEGRVLALLAPLAMLLPVWRRLRSMFRGGGAAPGHRSTVETLYVRMSLDHDTGSMTGTVLRGRLAGLRIEELAQPDLLALLRECRTDDEEGARLVEAYLDRAYPDWHDGLHGEDDRSAPRGASTDVTVDQAYAILGLSPGADAEAIKAAHHRLMKQLHPDHGGTDYLAAQLNRARDVLLKQR
jgi:hypothetical protein